MAPSGRGCLEEGLEEAVLNVLIDVEDLFEHARSNRRPSGIQRVAFEIARALAEMDGAGQRVRFLRHGQGGNSFRPVEWETVAQLFATLAGAIAQPAPALPEGADCPPLCEPPSLARRLARTSIARIPLHLREPLVQAIHHQRAALRFAGKMAALAFTAQVHPVRPATPTGNAIEPEALHAEQAFACEADPGDVLLALGAPWFYPEYPALVARAKRERAMRMALLVYDLIPIRRPEWCVPELPAIFRRFIAEVFPLADILLTISRATANDIVRYTAERGAQCAAPIVVPLGSGFYTSIAFDHEPALARELPAPGTYVLCVGTIEPRKNHALLLRLWRRLLDNRAPDAVPMLVLAGSLGWLIADLMQQLCNGDTLASRVVLIEDPTDAELRRLYAGCLFTVYPSFYEGWGLPVSESLAFGRACLVSNATSLPEAGGTLARYFDPENGEEAYQLICGALDNAVDLASWEARIAQEFRPTSWKESAASVLAALGQT
jgi:glycosyltransferase involved in cell wall biosynthesis